MLLQRSEKNAQFIAEQSLAHLERTYQTLLANKTQLKVKSKEVEEFYKILQEFAQAYHYHQQALQSYLVGITLLITQYWQLMIAAGMVEILARDFRYNKYLLAMWIHLPVEEMQWHSLKLHAFMLHQYLERDLSINQAQSFGYNLRAQIAASHQEFVEIIKDQALRTSLWQATSACLEHQALMALFEYEDIRKSFISTKAKIWAQGIFDRAPAIAAWLIEDKASRAWVEKKLTVETLVWINQHYPAQMTQLLTVDSVLQTLLDNPDKFVACINQQPNNYLALLRSLIKKPGTKSSLADLLAQLLRHHFADLEDVSVLYLYDMQTKQCADGFYQQVKQHNMALQVATQIYDNWFYDRHQMTAELALKIVTPFTQSHINRNETLRYRAHYYCAELLMSCREHKKARLHLVPLSHAKEALTADEHDQVIKYKQIANQGLPQHTFFAHAQPHRPYLEDMARSFHDEMFAKELSLILLSLTKQLEHYLLRRQTSGLFYALGIKNRQLSEEKNRLVSNLVKEVLAAQGTLKTVTTAEDAASIAQKLANQFEYAEKLNKALHKRHGRAIDSKGALGDQLSSHCAKLRHFTLYQSENQHRFVR